MYSYFSSSSSTTDAPISSLGYQTNNRYKQFPPLMSDGRSLVSSAQKADTLNDRLLVENNITSNWKYRQYMIKNANTIMEINYKESLNDTGYISMPMKNTNNKSTPYFFNSLNDNTKPYERTDLKELYLSREQMNAKKVIPILFK